MKRFIVIFWLGIAVFLLANIVTHDVEYFNEEEYSERFGFPFVVYQSGRRPHGFFRAHMLWANLAVAVGASALSGALYRTIGKRRTLGTKKLATESGNKSVG